MRVVIESPFAGDIQRNRTYARLCMNISLTEHDESPLAFHTIYTQCLSDSDPMHRKMGIERSFPWYEVAEKIVYMVDRGISTGMHDGFFEAKRLGRDIEFRTASKNPEFIREVASWTCIEQAELALEKISLKAKENNEQYFLVNQDITSFALERRPEIKMIEAVNQQDFQSPKRERHESILER
jgi:hypothetical protein